MEPWIVTIPLIVARAYADPHLEPPGSGGVRILVQAASEAEAVATVAGLLAEALEVAADDLDEVLAARRPGPREAS